MITFRQRAFNPEALADKMLELFVHRRDVYAEQYVKMVNGEPQGAYKLVHKPLTLEILKQHIEQKITIGTYLIDPRTNTVKVVCFDLDYGTKENAQNDVKKLYKICCKVFKESAVAVEFSGKKGYHVWVFFAKPIPASVARHFGKKILKKANLSRVELFPKQDYTTAYGNLVKLPFGKHKMGDVMVFVDGKNPNRVVNDRVFNLDSYVVDEDEISQIQKEVEKKFEKTWDEQAIKYPRYRGPNPPCIKWLLNGVGGPDAPDRTIARHDAALAIAGYYINLRAEEPKKVEEILVKQFNPACRPPLPRERQCELTKVVEDCLKNGYNYGCHSEPYSYGCNEKECPFKHPELVEMEKDEFPQEIIARAEEVLSSQEIIPYINAALDDVVGEEKTKVFMWFLQLVKQSIDLAGDSSTGKNATVDGVLRCHPLHKWWKITGSTDKSLRYLPQTIHTLYAAERRAITGKPGEETTTQFDMKLVISEGKLVIIVVEKLPSGKLETKKYETSIENIITTGTDVEIPPELENRLWEMTTDPSVRQNVAVRDRKLEQKSKPPTKEINVEEEKKVLRCAVEIIEEEAPKVIKNPFAMALKELLRPDKSRVRRDTDKLLFAIDALTYAHYRHRPILTDEDGTEFLLNLPVDFYWAWEYGQTAILGTFSSQTPRYRQWFNAATKICDAGKELTSETLSWVMGCEETTARSWLNKFAKEGYLTRHKVSEKTGGWHYEYTRTIVADSEEEVIIKFDDLITATYDWFKNYGYEITPVVSAQLEEANRKISGKILKVKVSLLTTVLIKDLPSRVELEDPSVLWGD